MLAGAAPPLMVGRAPAPRAVSPILVPAILVTPQPAPLRCYAHFVALPAPLPVPPNAAWQHRMRAWEPPPLHPLLQRWAPFFSPPRVMCVSSALRQTAMQSCPALPLACGPPLSVKTRCPGWWWWRDRPRRTAAGRRRAGCSRSGGWRAPRVLIAICKPMCHASWHGGRRIGDASHILRAGRGRAEPHISLGLPRALCRRAGPIAALVARPTPLSARSAPASSPGQQQQNAGGGDAQQQRDGRQGGGPGAAEVGAGPGGGGPPPGAVRQPPAAPTTHIAPRECRRQQVFAAPAQRRASSRQLAVAVRAEGAPPPPPACCRLLPFGF